MAIKTIAFIILSFIFVVVCLIALILASATDYWVVSTEIQVSGFKNLGLWRACFFRYRPPAWSLVDKYYDGCWWVFDRDMDDLRHFLFPPWFVGTQVLVSIGLALQLIAIIIMTINVINCFPHSKFKKLISLGLTIATVILHGLTAISLIVAVIMFGARADNERNWLAKPDQNYLSWSFGMCVLAAFLAILSFMTASIEFYRLRLRRSQESLSKMYLTSGFHIPATTYAYSNQQFQTTYAVNSNQNHAQPRYANRYSNNYSQSSLRKKPPNTIFAISGAGEGYVNHAYVNNENIQRGRTNGYVPAYDRRQVDGKSNTDYKDTQHIQHSVSSPKPTESQNVAVNKSEVGKNDYDESKKIMQPVLPEYVPKTKSENVQKIKIDNTLDESCDSDVKKKKDQDSGNESKDKKRSRSESKNKKSTRSRSSSEKHKKKSKKKSDGTKNSSAEKSKRSSKTRGSESDDSDEKQSRRRSRSKQRSSQSKNRKRSQSRESNSRRGNKSKDLNSSDSDSVEYSDSASVASRSRQKHRSKKSSSGRHRSASRDSTRKEKLKQSANEDGKKRDGGQTDDMSGSEYSSKKRSKVKSDGTKRAKSHDFSDTESVRSRQRSKVRGNQTELDEKKRAKSRDFSDNESVRSRQSRRSDHKLKGTYSSYYEY